jgi:CRP-like cAMP-binding protein
LAECEDVSVSPGHAALVQVLREDPELAEAIPLERRAAAFEECVARELSIPTGEWRGPETVASPNATGVLVLEGLILRRVGIGDRFGAELLGEGDVMRPWQREPESSTPLRPTAVWTVLDRTRIAVLDDDFLPYLARYPELTGCLLGRAIQRARNLAVNISIVHQARVDTRLHMLLWHLATRWGRVRADATVLPLRLTHAMLADLVAARRPTVTSALSDLARRGLVRYTDEMWVLSGRPPGVLAGVAAEPQSS